MPIYPAQLVTPLPVTGSVQVVAVQGTPIWTTGSVGLSGPVAVSNFPTGFTNADTLESGSVTGLLYGGVSAGQTNPFWVTGSVFVLNPSGGGAGGNVTVQSGSVTGLLVGGQPLALANPLPVTGTVGIASSVAVSNFPTAFQVSNFPATQIVTGTVGIASSVAVNNFPASQTVAGTVTSNQGTANTLPNAWPVLLASGSEPIGVLGTPLYVTGTVGLAEGVVTVNNFPSSFQVSNFPAGFNDTLLSGSVTGLLVGGQPLELTNPAPVTGTVSIASSVAVNNFPAVQTVTGSLSLASAPTVVQGTSPWVTSLASTVINSGSVTGLLYGGVAAGQTNPFWVTGSVYVINQSAGGAASNVTAVSGSVTGLLVGGQPLELTNPIPVTGTVSLSQAVAVSNFPASQTVAGTVTSNQGTANTLANAWPVLLASGSEPIGVSGTPLFITGTMGVAASVAVNNFPASQTVAGTVTANQGTANSLANAWPVTITSGSETLGGNSGTPFWVTGTVGLAEGVVTVDNFPASQVVTLVSTVINSGSITGLLYGGVAAGQTNPIWITGSVGLTNGSAGGSGGTVNQGTANTLSNAWPVLLASGSEPIGVLGTPLYVTGTVGLAEGIVTVNNFPANQPITVYGQDSTGSLRIMTIVPDGQIMSASSPLAVVAGQDAGSGKVYPVPLTGSGLNVIITGTVGIAASVAVNNFPASQTIAGTVTANQGTANSLANAWPVIITSGSETLGGNSGTPFWVTGSVGLTNGAGGSGGTVTQGNANTLANAWPVLLASGSEPIGVSGTPLYVTGTIGVAASVAVNNFPASQAVTMASTTANQGTANTLANAWPVLLASGSEPIGVSGTPLYVTGSLTLASAPQVNQGTSPWVVSLASTVINSGSITGLLLGGQAVSQANPIPVSGSTIISSGSVIGLLQGGQAVSQANPIPVSSSFITASGSMIGLLQGGQAVSVANPIPVSGTNAGIATLSGASPGLGEVQVFLDPGNLAQAGRVNNAGSHYTATPGVMGNRRITGTYRAVVGPLSATVGPMANIVNPNTGTLTVWVKQVQVTSVMAGSPPAGDQPVLIYMGASSATLTGTTVASVALSQSYPQNSTAVITSGGSNNVVTAKVAAAFTTVVINSGTAVFQATPTVNNLFEHGKENDDLSISPGHAYTVANTGPGQANFFYLVEFSWDEGGPV
jgi:hypothetical protein